MKHVVGKEAGSASTPGDVLEQARQELKGLVCCRVEGLRTGWGGADLRMTFAPGSGVSGSICTVKDTVRDTVKDTVKDTVREIESEMRRRNTRATIRDERR